MLKLLLFVAALLAAGDAQATWHQARTDWFTIKADMPAAELTTAATELATMDAVMRRFAGIGPGTRVYSRTDILVVEDPAAALRLTGIQNFYGGITIFNDLGELVIVSRRDTEGEVDLRRALFHEYAHSFTRRHLGMRLPGWFVEGFATYFETARPVPGGVKLGDIPGAAWAGFGDAVSFAFADVRGIAAERVNGPPPARLYAEGWLMVHHLFGKGPRADEIRAYMDAVSAGKPVGTGDAFFKGGVAGFDAAMNAWVRDLPVPQATAVPPVAGNGVTVWPMREGEARLVETRLRDLALRPQPGSTAVERRRAAVARFNAARPALDKYPDERELGLFVARLALRAGENKLAETVADRLLGETPLDPALLAFKADVLTDNARNDPRNFAALIARGRALAREAVSLDSQSPAAAAALYRNYAADQGGSVETRRLLDRALQLNPEDMELVAAAINHALVARDTRYVLTLLTPIANSPHDSEIRRQAIEMIRQLRGRK